MGENVTYGELASASDSSAPFESGTGLGKKDGLSDVERTASGSILPVDAGSKMEIPGMSSIGLSGDATYAIEPGAVCPTCGEKTPKLDALRMRAWRKRRKGD